MRVGSLWGGFPAKAGEGWLPAEPLKQRHIRQSSSRGIDGRVSTPYRKARLHWEVLYRLQCGLNTNRTIQHRPPTLHCSVYHNRQGFSALRDRHPPYRCQIRFIFFKSYQPQISDGASAPRSSYSFFSVILFHRFFHFLGGAAAEGDEPPHRGREVFSYAKATTWRRVMAESRMGRVRKGRCGHPPWPAAWQNRHAQLLGGGLHQCCSAHAFPCRVQGKACSAQAFQHFPRRCCQVPAAATGRRLSCCKVRASCCASEVGRGQHCDRQSVPIGSVCRSGTETLFSNGGKGRVDSQRFGQNTAVGHLGLQLNAG